jgi:hypothetical protein
MSLIALELRLVPQCRAVADRADDVAATRYVISVRIASLVVVCGKGLG